MKKLLLPLIVAAMSCGCAHTHTYSIKLDSDPQGAHVFLSAGVIRKTGAKDFLGTTPCVATVNGTRSGCFIAPQANYLSDYVAGVVKISMDPPSGIPGLYSHEQTYRTETGYVDGDKIPQGVFFDLHKP